MDLRKVKVNEPYRTLETRYLPFKSPWRSFREGPGGHREGPGITYSYAEVPRAAFVVSLPTMGKLSHPPAPPSGPGLSAEVPPVRSKLPTKTFGPAGHQTGNYGKKLAGVPGINSPWPGSYSSSAHIPLFMRRFQNWGNPGEMQPEENRTSRKRLIFLPAEVLMVRQGRISEGQSAYAILLVETIYSKMENDHHRGQS